MCWSSLGYIEDGPRSNFGSVKINSRQILIIGGKTHLEGLKKCDIWNIETKKWSSGPSLPITMKYCRATLLDEYVYVIGTYAEFYRLKIDQMGFGWQRLPPAKVDGLGCELVSDGNYIYRIGDNMNRTSLHRYDPRRHIWQELPQMENGRDFLGAAIIRRQIYVIGGRTGHSGDQALSSVGIYDITKKQWRPGPELPTMVYGHTAVAIKNFIFVSGGQQSYGSRALTSCYILNIETQHWTQLRTTLPQGFAGHSATANDWDVILIGGTSGDGSDKDKTIFSTNIKKFLFHQQRRDSDEVSTTSSLSFDKSMNLQRRGSLRRRKSLTSFSMKSFRF